MRVLFLMFAFPDMNKSFNMFTTLVEEFHHNGHDVNVVAPAVSGTKIGLQREAGIEVLRVKTLALKNVPNYLKGIANLLLPLQYKRALNRYYADAVFDLIIIPTPPITLANLAYSLKRKQKASLYLMLRDIFPQNAVDLGFMKRGGLLHTFFKRTERKLYKFSDYIGCMSSANIEYVKKHNTELDHNKLHILANFQKTWDNASVSKEGLRTKYNLEGRYVVVFGGNMGKPQQLENVIELAKRTEQYPDVLFLLLGEGIQLKQLSKEIEEKGIQNVRIQGTIPKTEYQDLLSICDIGLISLHRDFTIPNIPSKCLDYFNVGIPVLASIDKATDFGVILEEASGGLWSYAGDHDGFKTNFDKLYNDKDLRGRMGKAGKSYFEKFWIPEIAYNTIIRKINQ